MDAVKFINEHRRIQDEPFHRQAVAEGCQGRAGAADRAEIQGNDRR